MMKKQLALAAGFLLLSGAVCAAAASEASYYPLSITRGSRLMIAASINGHPVKAVLDSAAEATLVDRDFAAKLNLKSSSTVAGQGSGNGSFETGLANRGCDDAGHA